MCFTFVTLPYALRTAMITGRKRRQTKKEPKNRRLCYNLASRLLTHASLLLKLIHKPTRSVAVEWSSSIFFIPCLIILFIRSFAVFQRGKKFGAIQHEIIIDRLEGWCARWRLKVCVSCVFPPLFSPLRLLPFVPMRFAGTNGFNKMK